jgi:hypothetical protein
MFVAVFTTFAATRKEPLVDMVKRVHAGFVEAGFGEPVVRFSMSDAPVSVEIAALSQIAGIKKVSSIARVVKRWPQLERFAREAGSAAATGAARRAMSNLTETGTVAPVDFAIIEEIARGVPKSFPFHGINLHFSAPGFSEGPALPPAPDRQTLSTLMRAGVDIGAGQPTSAGISVQDSWWVNGRQRSLSALRIVEADPRAKKLPASPVNVASVYTACGKVRRTIQLPLVTAQPGAPSGSVASPPDFAGSETGEAIRSLVRTYRASLPELLETLPHDLPHELPHDDPNPVPLHGMFASGPKKPDLVRAFTPLGYDCRGESGSFTLGRRTPGNLTVNLKIDVGTWHSAVCAFMQVIGMVGGQGFKATLSLPVSRRAARGVVRSVEHVGQFPIGNAERWQQIVENLAALVGALDRSFVAEVEAISGPSPEWFRPDSV